MGVKSSVEWKALRLVRQKNSFGRYKCDNVMIVIPISVVSHPLGTFVMFDVGAGD